jgi:hypothetical protein
VVQDPIMLGMNIQVFDKDGKPLPDETPLRVR